MKNTNNKYSIEKFICMSLFVIILFPVIIILLSGNLLWIEGWIFSIWCDVMMLIHMIYMYVKDPALFSERLDLHGTKNQKKWDKYLLTSLFLFFALWICSMPLDAQMFKWSPSFPFLIKVIGCIFLILAFYLSIQATIENTYLSTVVRIQSDRQQKVISTGLYGVIRHPQYLGIAMMIIGGTVLLGSIIGINIGICIIVIIILRIIGEEKMLVEELDGYAEYRQRVKYRLLPFIW